MKAFRGAKGTRVDYWVKKEGVEYHVTLLSNSRVFHHYSEETFWESLRMEQVVFSHILTKGMGQKWKPTKKGSMTTYVFCPESGIGRLFIKEIE